MGDIKGVGRREEVTLICGTVVVGGQVGFQQGGKREVGRALFQALGIEVKKKVQFVFNGLHLRKKRCGVIVILDCKELVYQLF